MAYLSPPPRQCGIYYVFQPPVGPSFKNPSDPYLWLPLSSLSARAHIQHYSVAVTLCQTFLVPPTAAGTHPNGLIKSAKYSFPIYPACSVNSFIAYIQSPGKPLRTISGIIKPVQKAREIYDTAISEGKTAGLLEQQATDVFLMKLGNLPTMPGTEVKVEIGYVVELSHDSEVDGIKFVLPTTIAPRYGDFTPWNSGNTVAHNTLGAAAANWGILASNGINLEVKVSMPGPVTGIQSPSHPISVTMGSHGGQVTGQEFDYSKAAAVLELPNQTFLGKDFVVHVLCKEASAPRALLEKCTNDIASTCALMLTFVPRFVVPPAVASNQHQKPRKDIIFLVDLSGSMDNKVDALRSALTVFIKSLPTNQNAVFDICSFGTRHQFLFHDKKHKGVLVKGSQAYNKETMEIALDLTKSMKADFGGTELARPIEAICEMAKKREENRKPGDDIFETEILVLTDGEIWGVEELCDYVREQTKGWRKGEKDILHKGKSGVRIFTLGIGEDVSHGLVENLAKAGGGYSTIVGGNERYEGKVVRMLKAALSDRVGGFKLLWEGMDKWGLRIGSPSYNVSDETDDFEMVDAPESREPSEAPPVPPRVQSTSPPPVPPLAPISLFDPNADVDAPLETTYKPTKDSQVPNLQPPALVQAPHTIPPLFPFSRTNVYVLLTPPQRNNPRLPEKLTLRGYTATGQPLELSLAVTALEQPGTTIHQLATKKYLDDLREGDSWIHDAQKFRTKVPCTYVGDNGNRIEDCIELPEFKEGNVFGDSEVGNPKEKFDNIVRAEGERVGVSYSVAGKWTAFVAVEEVEGQHEMVKEVAQSDSGPMAIPAAVRIESRSFSKPAPLLGASGLGPGSVLSAQPPPVLYRAMGAPSKARAKATVTNSAVFKPGRGAVRAGFKLAGEDDEDLAFDAGFDVPLNAPGNVSPVQQTTTIIGYQQFDGYWSFKKTPTLVNFLKNILPIPKSDKEIKGDESDLWATILVLLFLERYLSGETEKEIWELIGEKGWDWVVRVVVGNKEKIQTVKDEVVNKIFA